MKRLLLILIAGTALVGTASAVENTYYKLGTVTAQAGVGLAWGGVTGSLNGGVDVGVWQLPLAREFPLDIGLAGRVGLSLEPSVGAGAYATAHYSWKAAHTDIDWLNHFETYLGLGLAFVPNLGLDGFVGLSYHFDNRWALYVESNSYAATIGGSYRF